MTDASVGRKAADFELPDQQGYPWSLSGQLANGPVVLIFYQGDWCPYCNGQLASYARNIVEFERHGAQLAGVSVDPPPNNADMVGKLLVPFPLLSDPRGDIARRYGLWDESEGVAMPATVVVDRSGEIRYLHSGGDFADRPDATEVLAFLEGLGSDEVRRVMGHPEIRIKAEEARRDTVRPHRPPARLEDLLFYYQGVFFATVALQRRFGGWGDAGRDALGEISSYQTMVQSHRRALEETVRLHRER